MTTERVERKTSGRCLALATLALFAAGFGSAGATGADGGFEETLRRARLENRLLVVVLVGRSGADTSWVRAELTRPEWTEAVRPHAQVILPAEESPSVAARLAATEFPQLILLDGEGREAGRMKGKQPVEVLAKKLRRLVEAAERFRQSEATLKANPLDPEALFWVGTYRWNRGDRFLAVECFQSLLDLGRGPAVVDRENLSAALRHLAQHRLDCGRLEEAEDFFRRALSSTRDEDHASSAALGLSMCLHRQARVLEAIQVLEERFTGTRRQAFLDQALFTLGYLYHEIGNREKASRYFDACREKFPDGLYGERSSRYFAPSKRSPGVATRVPRGTSEAAATPGARTDAASGATAAASVQAFTTASFSGSNLIVEELR